jgi:peptidoglycan hydrolase CwlO-like protein
MSAAQKPQSADSQQQQLLVEIANAYKLASSRSDTIIQMMIMQNTQREQLDAANKEIVSLKEEIALLKGQIAPKPSEDDNLPHFFFPLRV